LPEFDSIAVVSIITAIEEQLDCVIEDEEITSEVFETVGSLARFVQSKMF
jgi:acyl carrier protein